MKMNKLIKRLLSVLLSVIVALSFNVFVYAKSFINADENKIIIALQNTEYIKDDMGLTDIDFCDLCISEPINIYVFETAGFVFLRKAYPLLVDDNLVAIALEIENGAEKSFQISTSFIEKLNVIKPGTPFALVYDNEGVYAFYDECFVLFGVHSEDFDDRLKISDFEDNELPTDELSLVAITNSKYLNYSNIASPRIPLYYECDVTFVSQEPPSNMCWAASSAMIINYVRGYHYTAEQVARRYFGSNYNRRLPYGDEVNVLSNFSVAYTYRGEIKPSNAVILNNIQNGWPVFGCFESQEGAGHAVVIYAINMTSSYLYIKDPEFGSCTVEYDSALGYCYTSVYSGVDLTFNYATCHFWTTG